jgi:uncharacterized integral membrane protein
VRPLAGVVLAVGLAVYAALVAWRNATPVTLDLLFGSVVDVPVWSVALGSLLLGAVAAGLACAWPILRLRLRVRSQSRRLTRLEQEVHGLRTLPLSSEATKSARAREG